MISKVVHSSLASKIPEDHKFKFSFHLMMFCQILVKFVKLFGLKMIPLISKINHILDFPVHAISVVSLLHMQCHVDFQHTVTLVYVHFVFVQAFTFERKA